MQKQNNLISHFIKQNALYRLHNATAQCVHFFTYEYDANGFRTQKRQYGTDGRLEYYVEYLWLDGKLTQQALTLMAYRSDGTSYGIGPISAKFVYEENNQQPQSCLIGDTVLLFVRNLQGDVVAVVNGDGSIWAEFTYDAWGNVEVTSPLEDESIREAALKMLPLLCPLTYRGYNYDFTTGLYYLQSRYYNPEWGRFLNCDDTSILLATQGETHGANLFAYCNNNPVTRADYTGKNSGELEWLSKLGIGLYCWAILKEIGGYDNLLTYDVIDVVFKSENAQLLIANLVFKHDKKYYVLKMVLSELSYWKHRKSNLKQEILDFAVDDASGFIEGSLEEIANGEKDGWLNLAGDAINTTFGIGIVSLKNHIPVQYYRIMRNYSGQKLVIALSKVEKTRSKTIMKSMADILAQPLFYDRIEVLDY